MNILLRKNGGFLFCEYFVEEKLRVFIFVIFYACNKEESLGNVCNNRKKFDIVFASMHFFVSFYLQSALQIASWRLRQFNVNSSWVSIPFIFLFYFLGIIYNIQLAFF